MKNTEKTFDETELETPENIRLMISILDKAEDIIDKLNRLKIYVDKYFPCEENIRKKTTIIRRIV